MEKGAKTGPHEPLDRYTPLFLDILFEATGGVKANAP